VTSGRFVDVSGASAELLPGRPTWIEQGYAYLHGAAIGAEIEIRRLRHDRVDLFTRAVQPALWLLIFGTALSQIRGIPTGDVDYLTFITPGILAQSLMFIAIFHGLTIIWDRDQGILSKYLVLPVPRASFVAGKALGAAVRALSQTIVIFLLALVIGVDLRWTFGGIVASLLVVILSATFFATISIIAAIGLKSRERFMGFGHVITMPLFFASNAIYPISIMPDWLQVLASVNPLSYVVDLLRGYLVTGSLSAAWIDWTVLVVGLILVQLVAARTYHRVVV
jgi:ABC-2 type transport system permease protein